MFEKLMERAAAAGTRRAGMQAGILAERMRAELPRGIGVEAGNDGLALTGRGLRRRFALDPALRWLIARLR